MSVTEPIRFRTTKGFAMRHLPLALRRRGTLLTAALGMLLVAACVAIQIVAFGALTLLDGVAIPVCGAITFIYSQR